MGRAATWYLLAVVVTAQASYGDCKDAHFEFPARNADEIVQQYGAAVLRLEDAGGSAMGTGFLIDATRGLIITAAHVVYERDGTPKGAVYGRTIGYPNPLKLKRVNHLLQERVDLALLQLEHPSVLAHVVDLDVVADAPRRRVHGVVLGYAGTDRFEDADLEGRDATVVRARLQYEYGDFVFRSLVATDSATFPGMSGSPLIALDGTVVATLVADDGAKSTYFSTMTEIGQLLAPVELTGPMESMDQDLTNGTASAFNLTRRMKPGAFRDSFRNVELIQWGVTVPSHSEPYNVASRPLFDCPIAEAFDDRNLKSVTANFTALSLSSVRTASAQLARGEAEYLLDHKYLALELFRAAVRDARASMVERADAEVVNLQLAARITQLAQGGINRIYENLLSSLDTRPDLALGPGSPLSGYASAAGGYASVNMGDASVNIIAGDVVAGQGVAAVSPPEETVTVLLGDETKGWEPDLIFPRTAGSVSNVALFPADWEIATDPCVTTGSIYFGVGSARIPSTAATTLDRTADVLTSCPSTIVWVTGFTDGVGVALNNLTLSNLRATAASRELQARGVPPSRILIRGYGEAINAAEGVDDVEARRVEMRTLPPDLPAMFRREPGQAAEAKPNGG